MLRDGWVITVGPWGIRLKIPAFKVVVVRPRKWWPWPPPGPWPLGPVPDPWRDLTLGSAVHDHALDDLVALRTVHELAGRLHEPALTERLREVVADLAEGVASTIPDEVASVQVRGTIEAR